MFLLVLSFAWFIPSQIYYVSAEEIIDEEPNVTEESSSTTFKDSVAISRTVITDENLYGALLDLYLEYDNSYEDNVIYDDMFKDFESINLDDKGISSLAGIEKLELDNLISFSANSNEITSFDAKIFENTKENVFASISLANNKLSSFDIGELSGITSLDLSTNNLSAIDLSGIEGRVAGAELTISLAGNKIDSISKIVLPQKRIGHINLNIINNNITDITEEYFSNKYTLQLGVQGLASDNARNLSLSKNFVVYKTGIENLAVTVLKIDGDEGIETVATIMDSDITGNFKKLELPVGSYEYLYTIDGEDVYAKKDFTKSYLKAYEFNIVPNPVTYSFVYKGKTYDNLGKVTGKVTVNLFADEGATIYYKINGGEWVEGNTVVCDNGGNYTIKVKSEINGVYSEESNIWVKTSLNLYISDAVMLILVLLLALVLFVVVLPIVSKKYFKKD